MKNVPRYFTHITSLSSHGSIKRGLVLLSNFTETKVMEQHSMFPSNSYNWELSNQHLTKLSIKGYPLDYMVLHCNLVSIPSSTGNRKGTIQRSLGVWLVFTASFLAAVEVFPTQQIRPVGLDALFGTSRLQVCKQDSVVSLTVS